MSTQPAAVVIGTSAGGIDALSKLLPVLPANAPFAVIVVIHLPRDRPSLLCEIFRPKCAMAVREADDKEPIVAGTVYFAPPDYHLLVDQGGEGPHLALNTDELLNFSRPAIDSLFESAAYVYGQRLSALILTGANHDGAAGLAAVQAAGGQCIVQKPETAQSAEMPLAALASTLTAHRMSLDEMAVLLHHFCHPETP